jgi:hypothetical protein
MTQLLKITALAAMLAVGSVTAMAVQAEENQPSPMSDGMNQRGMMGGEMGRMMGQDNQHGTDDPGGMADMKQMNEMMSHCHQMMDSRMQAPNSQTPEPEHKG